MSQNTQVNDIINLLQAVEQETSFNVFVPSLQKNVKFKPLSTEQLKRILKTVVDSPIYSTEFTITINSIIKENCLDKTVTDDTLTIYDKLLVVLKLRTASISDNYTFTFTEEEIETYSLAEKTKTISYTEHYEDFIKHALTFPEELITIDSCLVTCNLPSLQTENRLEKELHKNAKIDVSTPEELRTIVGETFINEVTKFISNISINDIAIDLTNLSFKERIRLVEKLPTKIINQVIKYIEKYRNSVKPLTTVKVQCETTSRGLVDVEKEIPLDATLFNM